VPLWLYQSLTELGAGGFGLLGGKDTGATEAHNEFAATNDTLTRQKDGMSNGACVACHTHVAVDITYTKPQPISSTQSLDQTAKKDLMASQQKEQLQHTAAHK